jgi:hypothetical protein
MAGTNQPNSRPMVDMNRLAKEIMKLLKAELRLEAERSGRLPGPAGAKK